MTQMRDCTGEKKKEGEEERIEVAINNNLPRRIILVLLFEKSMTVK
jgi:hypothetical protein